MLDDDADVRLLKGLADPGRLAIVRRLSDEGAVAASDLATCCDTEQPTLSHHLRVLRETGWVRSVRRGTRRFYSLEPGAVARLGRIQREIGRAGEHGLHVVR